jgi:hypothetical protein
MLWPELVSTPEMFTLYGGTALALHKNAERIQVAPNTLTCRVDRGGPVLVSFFGNLGLGQVAPLPEIRWTIIDMCTRDTLRFARLSAVCRLAVTSSAGSWRE